MPLPAPLLRPPLPIPGQRPVAQTNGAPTSGRPRYMWTQQAGPVRMPDDMSDADAAEMIRRYDDQIAKIQQTINSANDFERHVAEVKLDDLIKARENAMKIAQLQADTSRYGYDVGRQNALDQLKENARQYDLRHGLDVQQLGLDRADKVSEWMARDDRWAQAGNFIDMSGRVLAGQPGAGTYGRAVQGRPNTEADFAVLESGGNPYAARGSAQTAATAGGGAGTDARVAALKKVIDASPPSAGSGHDANDFAVMQAAKAIYSMNLTPQQQASINSSPQYKNILSSEIQGTGNNAAEWWKRQQSSLPGQGSVRLA